ncbi:MAG: glycosyltransferase family 4 protein [Desulfobacula sp.]|jgi:glycosyltransferase involved in cell wall biosynthesis|uniref:glycosyltransferase family 4 protein n=1 Tax=Desulfobacula sp. TaxID=2593537 RepID=UPI001D2C815D|nr:glycosyltransferase family 4 protein [Desulfobacula sp.]MBT3484483.1 glycosyltransferase family 4 protein [Desulfobacula sp.]MBT3803121.1 glycosyltransferase family 4 protein [Desulfobacula sp.]MBT4024691.1 glycosyltransferase family 4 protein [Desulfobacula sp.]MBT4197169.1 glycosyltransferase family 4 protein [Desulfobacula sp.]
MRSLYKILHTTCHTQWGGLEKRIFNESVWMKKNGHNIVIAAPKNTPLFLKAVAAGFKVYGIEFNRFSIIKDYKILKRIFKDEKPDIINTHGNKDSKLALFAAKNNHVPLRILSRHISAHVKNSWYNRLVYKKWCHYIFTTADYTTRHLQKVFKLKDMQIFSMPSGIMEPNFLLKKIEARKVLAKELGLDPKTKFIGFVGRVSKDKGVSCLLEAFKKARPKLSGYHVAIVGGGTNDYINLLKKQAKELQIEDYIHFTGLKKNVWQYYRAIDCKVLPSRDINGIPFEGIPQSLLEAMICECPVVGSKSGGIVDIIDNEKTGLLFDTDDSSDLAEKILLTLQYKDATRKRVESALAHIKKHHTINTMGKNIIRLYRLHQVKMDRLPY